MMRRKPFEAASNAAAVQRSAIEPLGQFLNRRILSRVADWPSSMMFVVPRQRRESEEGHGKQIYWRSSFADPTHLLCVSSGRLRWASTRGLGIALCQIEHPRYPILRTLAIKGLGGDDGRNFQSKP